MLDNFSKFGWTVPLKNKNAQTITNILENILKSTKRRANSNGSGDGSEFVDKTFTNLLNNNNIMCCSTITSLGAVFAERLNRIFRDQPKKPILERCDGIWVDNLPTVTRQFKNRIPFSTKLTPIHASSERRRICWPKFFGKTKEKKTKF